MEMRKHSNIYGQEIMIMINATDAEYMNCQRDVNATVGQCEHGGGRLVSLFTHPFGGV